MQFGRETQGGLAMSVVSIDNPISDALMAKVKQLPNVLSVKLIKI
jgi:D-3-phosphoglycerate dehydrogenase